MQRSTDTLAGLLLATLLALPAPPARALPEDRLQPIEISAERAVRDERAGFTRYTGAVVLVQGSLRIEASTLTIFHDRESADRIVAEGEPAYLRQTPAPDQQPVNARARRIVYFKSLERVVLRTEASIEQEGAVVTGDTIEYRMAEQRVLADAAAADSEARVQVIIPPQLIEAPGDNGGAATLPDATPDTDETRDEGADGDAGGA
jgi:lipopolysaccharide export system protein LptA